MDEHFKRVKFSQQCGQQLGQQRPRLAPVYARGALLLEVMVCALLLAVGILAIVAGQTVGVQSSRSAYFHVQAEALVNDMVDRLTSNPDVIDRYNGKLKGFQGLTLPGCVSARTGCTAEQRARADLVEWASLFSMVSEGARDVPLLPNADAAIEISGDDEAMIWVQWRQEAGSFIPQTRSACGNVPAEFQRVCAEIKL